MFRILVGEVFEPLVRRLGTAGGAYLVGLGVSDANANAIVTGGIALVGVGVDLVASHLQRRAKG